MTAPAGFDDIVTTTAPFWAVVVEMVGAAVCVVGLVGVAEVPALPPHPHAKAADKRTTIHSSCER